MSREVLKGLGQAIPRSLRASAAPRIAVAGGSERVALRPDRPRLVVPLRDPAPIVQFPAGDDWNTPSPRAVATADLKVKQFRGRHVDEDRFTTILHATSDAPAALLAALADAAGELEEFGHERAPEEQLIMHITIRRS